MVRRRAMAAGVTAPVLALTCACGALGIGSPVSQPSELTYSEAVEGGLLRTGALRVSGPPLVVSNGEPTRVTVTITLPDRPQPGSRIDLEWSGDCTLGAGRRQLLEVPAGTERLTTSVTAASPGDGTWCFLRAGASFLGKPETGDRASISMR